MTRLAVVFNDAVHIGDGGPTHDSMCQHSVFHIPGQIHVGLLAVQQRRENIELQQHASRAIRTVLDPVVPVLRMRPNPEELGLQLLVGAVRLNFSGWDGRCRGRLPRSGWNLGCGC